MHLHYPLDILKTILLYISPSNLISFFFLHNIPFTLKFTYNAFILYEDCENNIELDYIQSILYNWFPNISLVGINLLHPSLLPFFSPKIYQSLPHLTHIGFHQRSNTLFPYTSSFSDHKYYHHLTNITHISFQRQNMQDFNVFTTCSNLTSVHFKFSYICIQSLSQIPTIQTITIYNCSFNKQNLNFSNYKKLTTLCIRNCHINIKDIQFNKNIRNINIQLDRQWTSDDNLFMNTNWLNPNQCKNLYSIELKSRNLTDISSLSSFSNLHIITFRDCSNLQNISSLSSCPNLKYIIISQCPQINKSLLSTHPSPPKFIFTS